MRSISEVAELAAAVGHARSAAYIASLLSDDELVALRDEYRQLNDTAVLPREYATICWPDSTVGLAMTWAAFAVADELATRYVNTATATPSSAPQRPEVMTGTTVDGNTTVTLTADPQPVTLDVKRFYLPGFVLRWTCPNCGYNATYDFGDNYLSDPHVNGDDEKVWLWCEHCDAESEVLLKFALTVELAATG